ncbi:unnamed protein product [Bursaphelenchus xylophilus]|uniref:Eukaryotic translation initiation factor 2A n=1 Tax=Bursaphelenchus xylophilus TaxID=6326 RepID=A0A1I7SDF1_BURXY|nr:unnamed protein product [Bursaphelenchus xylophilus]CAG9130649.1 unnamed protein product [Bursaphelenchus xylophilus]
MAEKLVYAYRSANGLKIRRGLENAEDILSLNCSSKDDAVCRCFQFSPSGRFFAYCDNKRTVCYDVVSKKERFAIEGLGRTMKLTFSPNENLLITYQQYAIYGMRTGEDGVKREPEPNLRFYDIRDGKEVAAKICKSQANWKPQFSTDEKFCVLKENGSELHFYENNKFDRFTRKGVIKGLETFELGPGLDPSLCCFIPSVGGKPGLIQLRNPHDELRVITQKTSFNCDVCSFNWNSKGSAVLATTTVEVDKTNQSYYGISCLYLLTKMGDSFQVHLNKEGPLHSLEWSPNGMSFIACFGYMPAKICVFNLRATSIWCLGESHKNEVYYNPFGSLLAVCGFGNLAAGKIEVWDVEKKTEVVQMEVPNTTYFSWAPDGQHFMTATTSPRLRVDNNFRIWHYTGQLKYEYLSVDSEKKAVEMAQVVFKPAPGIFNKFKIIELTDAERRKIENRRVTSSIPDHSVTFLKNAGVVSEGGRYVPPHLRKSIDPSPRANQNSSGPRVELTANEKQIQKLKKKIEDIKKLKQKTADGIKLELNQRQKLDKLPELEAELKQLEMNGS